jgi:glycosyltransferase involved in cell wall biosynthesis
MKLLVITCYFDPDYVRSRSIRAALEVNPDIEVHVIKNTHLGLRRYPEITWKLIKARRAVKPDGYILMFRGQEILPMVLLLAGKKPVLFDEFIVPLAWARDEKHRATLRVHFFRLLAKLSAPLYKRWLAKCRVILTDTPQHAQISAELSGLPLKKYQALPVGTDETLFKPGPKQQTGTQVFFYGSKMTPLHGLPVILKAAEMVATKNKKITFLVSGGDKTTEKAVATAVRHGAQVKYRTWTLFDEIPKLMQQSLVCLGGPFGSTPQAQRVITGKTYQSLACAAPTIVGDTVANAALTNHKDCLKVPLGNPAALATAILWAYDHPSERATLGQAGRVLYQKMYSNEVISHQLAATLRAL